MYVYELIDLGARMLAVPGTFPLGCMLALFILFLSLNNDDHETGCIKRLNKIAEFHNRYLKGVARFGHLNPHVTIPFGDYYGSTMNIPSSPCRSGKYQKRSY
jgi:hypothetical protein